MAKGGSVPERKMMREVFKWDLSKVYASKEDWERDLTAMKDRVKDMGGFKGKLKGSNSVIAECLHSMDDVSRSMGKLYTYAHLRHDEDVRDPVNLDRYERCKKLLVELGTETSFFEPELLMLPKKRLDTLLTDPALRFAAVPLREIIRMKEHTLSVNEERLLAMASDALSSPSKVFKMLNDADLTFPSIPDGKGRKVEISHGRFIGLLMNRDRKVRENAFRSFYSVYRSHRNTFTASLEGELKRRALMARLRKYPSALAASLDDDKVSVEVYESLIKAVRSAMPDMHSYMDIRRKALGLRKVHMYDIHVPLVPEYDPKIPFPKAKEIVLSALSPLGPEVEGIVKDAFSQRWMDVYENRGKRSGAYSSGCYDSPSYILMNYENGLKDLFTVAHELGHSVHSTLSNRHQPHITSEYSIFVAEVASTVNEVLLLEHLKKTWKKKDARTYLVNHHLDEFRSTVFRQTMFAEFEKDVSGMVEKDIPLTPDLMDKRYLELNRDHFGENVEMDEGIASEWARIPHFYYDFYVYKYATGYSAATVISKRILEGGNGALDSYLEMLRSGGSLPPLELLKGAGVDLTTEAPVKWSLKVFSDLLTELERLL